MSDNDAHHHRVGQDAGDRRVLWAVAVNVLLTVGQVLGGIFSGSLSLIADALHNFSDAASLGIAFAARRIARHPSDETMTFGYVRAEIVAALINYTTLIVIGLYLVYEAVMRAIDPQPVDGWLVVIVAGLALIVDLVTAALTYALSKTSMNIRAAFLHNIADALGSIGVMVAGTLIILFDWRIIDPIITLLIAGYILWQAFTQIGGAIRMHMLGTPPGIDARELVEGLRSTEGVRGVHHVHVWAIDEQENALEAHIVVANETGSDAEAIRKRIKTMLRDRFAIGHTTLELERADAACEGESAMAIGHRVEAARAARDPDGG
jgi:cobalt-zinc-cadmium efflux system protein